MTERGSRAGLCSFGGFSFAADSGFKDHLLSAVRVGSEEWDTSNWEVLRRVTDIAHFLCIDLLSFMLLWKKIKFPCTLDAGKTDGKYFLSELFFLGGEMDFQQKTVLESFRSLEKSYRSGLNKHFLLINILCG